MRLRMLIFFLALSSCPEPQRRWTVFGDAMDRIPLCAWGAAPDDVWIGGGFGTGGLLLHWDGKSTREIALGRPETIWWIHGSSPADIWAVGDSGLTLHSRGGDFVSVPSGTTATLFGVWAASANDAWAVGGSPNGSGPNDVILHWDGTRWSEVPLPDPLGAAHFKVWGRTQRDVFVVGQGTALHFDGLAWTRTPVPTKTSLFTVHGGARGVFAIGGPPPVLLSWDGAAWRAVKVPETMSSVMSGISAAKSSVFLVGERGQRYRWDENGVFTEDTDAPRNPADLHAVFVDTHGDAFAVGGNYLSGGPPRGTILRYSP